MRKTRIRKIAILANILILANIFLLVVLVLQFVNIGLYTEAMLGAVALILLNIDNHVAGIYNRLNGK